MDKIICPFHLANGEPEKTPSCAIYADGYYCFGCGAAGPLRDLQITTPPKPRPKEDIHTKLTYISRLSKADIRGLQLPADRNNYYILWPDNHFYIQRSRKDSKSRYYVPAGHSRPLFYARRENTKTLWFVEGEINALSLAQAVTDTVVSPGAATKFYKNDLNLFRKYDTIYLVADSDVAGCLAAIELYNRLKVFNKKIYIQLWSTDANDILVQKGIHGLRQEIEKQTRGA